MGKSTELPGLTFSCAQEAVGGQSVSPGPELELSGVFWQLELWGEK